MVDDVTCDHMFISKCNSLHLNTSLSPESSCGYSKPLLIETLARDNNSLVPTAFLLNTSIAVY
jgi:hypothetical protein